MTRIQRSFQSSEWSINRLLPEHSDKLAARDIQNYFEQSALFVIFLSSQIADDIAKRGVLHATRR